MNDRRAARITGIVAQFLVEDLERAVSYDRDQLGFSRLRLRAIAIDRETSGSISNGITRMAFRAIDHVQLAMPPGEEEKARAFYAGVLGLQEIPKPLELAARGGAWFRDGGVAVHLGVDQHFRPATRAHPAFRCDDLAALLKRLMEHGSEIVRGDSLEGRAHFYVMDPFGNRIELIEDDALT